MPKAMEKALKKTAKKKFPGNEKRQNKYVYGRMRDTGWVPSTQKKTKKSTKKASSCSGGKKKK